MILRSLRETKSTLPELSVALTKDDVNWFNLEQ